MAQRQVPHRARRLYVEETTNLGDLHVRGAMTADAALGVDISGVAAYATLFEDPVTLNLTGDASGSAVFAGGGSVNFPLALAETGAAAGSYGALTATLSLVVDAKGRITGIATNPAITPAAIGAVPNAARGIANGVATLDGTGKLTSSQIPASIAGGLAYQGFWNASTNTPTLTSGVGVTSQYYKVSVGGSTLLDGNNTWNPGDLLIFNGATWDRLEGDAGEVTSVAGRSGDVVLVAADITDLSPPWFVVNSGPAPERTNRSRTLFDTSGGPISVPLPATPLAGMYVIVSDYAGTFGTNNLTVQRNGANIMGLAEDFLCDADNATLTFEYIDATKGWLVY